MLRLTLTWLPHGRAAVLVAPCRLSAGPWASGAAPALCGAYRLAARPGRGVFSFVEEIARCRRPEDYLSLFRENRDFFPSCDLCALLEGLWAQMVRAHGHKAHAREAKDAPPPKDAQKELFNSPDFMQVMKDIVRKLHLFGPAELPRLLFVLHTMRWNDKHLFKVAEPMVIRHLPMVAVSDLRQLVASFAATRGGSRLLYDELIHRCSQAMGELGSSDLVALVVAFADSPHKHKTFLLMSGPQVEQALSRFTPQELALVMQAYGKHMRNVSPELAVRFARLLLEDEAALIQHRLSPTQLVVVVQTLALWAKHKARILPFVEVFELAAERLLMGRGSLHPSEATTVLWAYTRVRVLPTELLGALQEDVRKGLHRIPEVSLAAGLLASARLACGQLRDPEENEAEVPGMANQRLLADTRLLDAAEQRVQKVVRKFDIRELTSVVLAYALGRAGSPELYSVLQRSCVHRSSEFPADQASSVLWSFATVRLGTTFFREVQVDIIERLSQFTDHAICDVIWAFCVVRHYDPHFFKVLLSTLLPSRVAGDSRCALLYPALLDIRARFPDFDPAGLERYMGYVSAEFRRAQLETAPNTTEMLGVAEALNMSDFDYEMPADIDGYIVDALVRVRVGSAEEEASRAVGVLYHSCRTTLHPRTSEPLGQTMLRQRYLQCRSLGIVNLWDRAWADLALEGRAAYLQEKVSAASKRPTPNPAVGGDRASDAVDLQRDPIMDAGAPERGG